MVVIAIIAILASMLLPALNKARARGKSTKCLGNLKQVAMAAQFYANDNREYLVFQKTNCTNDYMGTYWFYYLAPYAGTRGRDLKKATDGNNPFHCPADTDGILSTATNSDKNLKVSYLISSPGAPRYTGSYGDYTFRRLGEIQRTVRMCYFLDFWPTGDLYFNLIPQPTDSGTQPEGFKHQGSINAAFFDGHVRSMTGSAMVKEKNDDYGDWFLYGRRNQAGLRVYGSGVKP